MIKGYVKHPIYVILHEKDRKFIFDNMLYQNLDVPYNTFNQWKSGKRAVPLTTIYSISE